MIKFSAFLDLMRLRSPTGYLLLFFPCAFGTLLAIRSAEELWYLPLFLLGSITMRGAGCIVNDIIDKDIDAKVERTKSRPLVIGLVTKKEAVILLCLLMLISLPILLILHTQAIIIGITSLLFVAAYPWTKRITYFPQAFLGVTFNIGVLIAYSGIRGNLDLPVIFVYIGCIFWTLGYDTIYAFMDIEDDAKIGVKSSALFLQTRNYKLWIICFYLIFICLISAGTLLHSNQHSIQLIVMILVAFCILAWQALTLDVKSRAICFLRFKSNIYVGLALCVGIAFY